MTDTVNATIANILKTEKPGSTLYNLASQYKHWIMQATSERERIETINEAHRIFVRKGIIKS